MRLERRIEELANALAKYQETWLRMSCLDPSLLVEAPTQGHELSAQVTAILRQHKTPEVAALLKRLPYVSGYDRPAPITYNTHLIDYWHDDQVQS